MVRLLTLFLYIMLERSKSGRVVGAGVKIRNKRGKNKTAAQREKLKMALKQRERE